MYSSSNEAVYEWRRSVFLSLGFGAALADYMAMTRIELEATRNMIARGCPLDLVLAILAGTNQLGEDDFVDSPDTLDFAQQPS